MKQKIFISLLAAVFCASAGTLKAQNCATGYCPDTIKVHHFSGDISPETVTIDYPVVQTTLGSSDGSSYCWITQNLGAKRQAVVKSGPADDAAGWYWQFGRKQGYAWNTSTTTTTPSWPGIVPIVDSDWPAQDDPCTLLLGSNWRLPTLAELTNADTNGNWDNYTDTYNSVLKLHGAGYLDVNAGTIVNRGVNGYMWSSTKAPANIEDNKNSHYMNFSGSSSRLSDYPQSIGFSVRCLSAL